MASADEEEEEDYMSMVITDSSAIVQETSLQRIARIRKEREAKSQPKSKQERMKDEQAAREAALAKSMESSNKGFKMMAKLGYKPGATLGKSLDARTEPIHLSMKEDRGGVGMDSEKKRKMRELLEETEQQEKRAKTDQTDYREWMRQQRENKRHESQLVGAQKVAEQLDTEAEQEKTHNPASVEKRSLKSINVYWRGREKSRRERVASERMKKEVQNTLTYRLPDSGDSDEDDEDEVTNPKRSHAVQFFEQELEDEDPELDEFNDLDLVEKLAKVVTYLRSTYRYCFWCKMSYEDDLLVGCPGITEEDHEL